ncbi:MAG: hypothetical protein ACE5HS_12475 [bacterium]
MKKHLAVKWMILIWCMFLVAACQKNTDTAKEKVPQKDLLQCMDEYHRILRPLIHQALPNEDFAAFKKSSQALLICAKNLEAAATPEKYGDQKAEIELLTAGILTKTHSFQEICQSGSDADILDAFIRIHDDYEALADIVYKL